MKAARVGVLSLQGASAPHRAMFARLGLAAREVRSPGDLEGLSHLVLPGGESTTMQRLLALFGLEQAIVAAHRRGELALFGTCAGAILLARGCGGRPRTLGLLAADAERNAYGRQLDSSLRRVPVPALGRDFPCLFIRAPKLRALGPEVAVLARDGDDPVAVEAPGLLATTFHPELGDDPWFHRRFLG
jgi:5'-phosphate synthase pdxT subunit